MSRAVDVVWDESFLAYNFGPTHPMSPVRVDLTIRLARELGVLDHAGVRIIDAQPASDELLRLVHVQGYIDAVKEAGHTGKTNLIRGLGDDDNPVFPSMHEASAHIVGATVACAAAVLNGQVEHAVNVTGGLHHAMPDHASGFCVYNDPAVAIAWLLASGVQRVAYVDVDVHHGDGVERVFYDDPRVMTVSLHESGRTLWPGTGWPDRCGGPAALGTAVNVALPAGTGDDRWLRAFHAIVPPLVEAFAPQFLVTQHGADTHLLDPLADLALTVDAQRAAAVELHALAHRFTGGRWLATGGGGYEVVDVVPRAWTHLIAEAVGHPVDPATDVPATWREYVVALLGRPGPARMTDGRPPRWRDFADGYDPADPVDRAIMATRSSVFPHHGLDPQP
jgi:acetoin utilization protein AcuC